MRPSSSSPASVLRWAAATSRRAICSRSPTHSARSCSTVRAIAAGVGYVESHYQAPIPLLEVTRRDRNLTLTLSALYLISARWSVRAEYQYAHNAANLELFEYSRHVGAVKVRYEFK